MDSGSVTDLRPDSLKGGCSRFLSGITSQLETTKQLMMRTYKSYKSFDSQYLCSSRLMYYCFDAFLFVSYQDNYYYISLFLFGLFLIKQLKSIKHAHLLTSGFLFVLMGSVMIK